MADHMATPDLLGQLAEVSQLQLHRVTSANSNSSASAQRPTTTTTTTTGSHEPSPVDSSSDSFHSPNSATTTTYLQQQQQQQRYRSEDAQAQAALYPNAVAVDPVTTSSSSSHKAKDGPVITRQRQQVSCAECHRRKQSCSRQVPCTRCIERGIASKCFIAQKGTNKVHRRSDEALTPNESPSSSSAASSAPTHQQQQQEPQHPPKKRRKANSAAAQDKDKTAGVLSVGQLIQGPSAAGEGRSVTYLGPSSLVSVLRHSMPDGQTVAPSAAKLMHNPCGGITKAPGVTIGTLATWLQKLPPRIVSDRLVEEYFTAAGFTHWLFSSSHKPSFLLKYRELWSCAHSPPEHNERAPVSLSFFGLVCFVVCTTLQFLPDDLAYLTDNRTAELSAQLHDLGRQALSASEVEDPPDRFRVEAILMDGLYSKHEGRPIEIYSQIAMAVRIAQGLGMHRSAPPDWQISPLEDQLRKRLWWALYSYDRISSLNFGRPYVTNDQHIDVDLPANIDNCDLTADGPRNIQPPGIVTDTTALLMQIQLAKITGKVFDSCFSIHVPTYQTVLDLDQELHKLELSVPVTFRAPDANEVHRRPYLRYSFGIFLSIICRLREQLHRPYLIQQAPPGKEDPFAVSKTAAVTLARRVLACLRDIRPFIHPKYFIPWAAYESGATLCVAALMERRRNPHHNTKEMHLIDETVKDAIQLLECSSNSATAASESLLAVKSLREQYLLPPQVEATPGASGTSTQGSRTQANAPVNDDIFSMAWMNPPDALEINPANLGLEQDFLSTTADFQSWQNFSANFMPEPQNAIPPLFAPMAPA